jgi:hypothetical protein
MCAFVLILPNVADNENISQTRLPSYLHMTSNSKVIASYILGRQNCVYSMDTILETCSIASRSSHCRLYSTLIIVISSTFSQHFIFSMFHLHAQASFFLRVVLVLLMSSLFSLYLSLLVRIDIRISFLSFLLLSKQFLSFLDWYWTIHTHTHTHDMFRSRDTVQTKQTDGSFSQSVRVIMFVCLSNTYEFFVIDRLAWSTYSILLWVQVH